MVLSWWARRRQLAPSGVTKPSGRDDQADSTLASGVAAGRREVAALEPVRSLEFGARAEQQLHNQLARAPRDVGALFGLMKWHVEQGNAGQAASFAHALWDETDAEGALWQSAAALGRSLEPENPLYSEDPFTALAQHAATQPVHSVLPLHALDLSLSDHDAAARQDASGSSAAEDADAAPRPLPVPLPIPLPAFDFLNAPDARLPASFASLSLDFDDTPMPMPVPVRAATSVAVAVAPAGVPAGVHAAPRQQYRFVRGKRARRLPGR